MLWFVLIVATSAFGRGVLARLGNFGATAHGGVYNVTAYGAKGDGIHDDAPAIQKALDAAAAGGGGSVTFPCGEFALLSIAGAAPSQRSVLYLKEATNVQVSGHIAGQRGCTHVFTSLPQKSVFEFDKSTNISLLRLHITALNTKYVETYGMSGGSAIRYTGVTAGSIRSVEVDGASAGALYMTDGTNKVLVANNYVHDTLGAGIWEDDCGGSNRLNCLPSKPSINNTYDSNTLRNTALDALSALDIDNGNGISNAMVSNNIISWTRSPVTNNYHVQCIQVNNASGVHVLNNHCSGSPWNGIVITTGVRGYSENVTIKDNTIQNSGTSPIGGAGIVVYDDPDGLGVSGFTISHNTISIAADNGITVAASRPGNVHDGTVIYNSVSMADQRSPGSSSGIAVERGASIRLTSNTIAGNKKCIAVGVKVSASTSTSPTSTANAVVNILGQPLLIH